MAKAKKMEGEWVHSPKKDEWHEDWERVRRSSGKWVVLDSGILGPAFSTVLFMVVLVAFLWALKFANAVLNAPLIAMGIESVVNNIQWFFLFPLFVGYCDYFLVRSYRAYLVLWPMANAARFTFAIWISAWVLKMAGASLDSGLLLHVAWLARVYLVEIAAILLISGYIQVALMALLLKSHAKG